MPWITPSASPEDLVKYEIWLPPGVEYQACAVGAFLDLTREENWEQVGGQAPDVVAEAFNEGWEKSIWWRVAMPIGAIIFGGWDTAPENFLLCDGASYSTTTYADLFAAIGYKFGGSGGNFNVPQTADKMPIGKSGTKSIGNTGGASTHQLTVAELASHAHPILAQIIPSQIAGVTPTYGWTPTPFLATNSAGGDQPHNNMPPWLALNAAIAYR